MKIGRASDFYERNNSSTLDDKADDRMDVDEIPYFVSDAAPTRSTTSEQSTGYSKTKRKYPELADQSLSGSGKRVCSGDASRNVSGSSTSTQTGSIRSASDRSVHVVNDQYSSARMGLQYEPRENTKAAGDDLSTFEEDFSLYSGDDAYYQNVYTLHKKRLGRSQTDNDSTTGEYNTSRK